MRTLKALALGTIPVVGALVCVALVYVILLLRGVRQDERNLAGAAQTALATVNRPCATRQKLQPCGTLAEIDKALSHTDDAVILGGKAIRDADLLTSHEAQYVDVILPQLVAKANVSLDNVNAATGDLHPLLLETTRRVAALGPVEDNAAKVIAAGNVLIADPRIPDAVANFDAASVQVVVMAKQGVVIGNDVRDTTDSVKAIAADGQHYVHSTVYPKPVASIANWTLKVVHAIGGFF